MDYEVVWNGRGSLPWSQDWPAQKAPLYVSSPDAMQGEAAPAPVRGRRGEKVCRDCRTPVPRNAGRCEPCLETAMQVAARDYTAGMSAKQAARLHQLYDRRFLDWLADRGLKRPNAEAAVRRKPTGKPCACGKGACTKNTGRCAPCHDAALSSAAQAVCNGKAINTAAALAHVHKKTLLSYMRRVGLRRAA